MQILLICPQQFSLKQKQAKEILVDFTYGDIIYCHLYFQ